jgi:hypothetical protein
MKHNLPPKKQNPCKGFSDSPDQKERYVCLIFFMFDGTVKQTK